MGCIFFLLALITPRLVLFFIWLLTDYFSRSYATLIWPLLGFFFMPYTTLAYMAAMLNNNHQLAGGWVVLLIVAVVVDLGHIGGGRQYATRKR